MPQLVRVEAVRPDAVDGRVEDRSPAGRTRAGTQQQHIGRPVSSERRRLAGDLRLGHCLGDVAPNVLHGGRRLVLVDPREMNGETAYDIAVPALELNCDDLDTARAASIVLGNGDDPDRPAAWAVVADASTA
ncbi:MULTISPECIES: hypothetical protein [unclassified Pseudonocardia]|uniref:hypothetical protein n=1 Tax=unclassified Pseudonocardia TaxID=2619320 RepID=UPI0011150817|nr:MULTISPECIES: hypothetical protein [unclassified Pseudonocardia]